jgi:hypothetical protein
MFRTELTIAPQERLLPRTARVLTVGSCFADSIGERLRLNKVNTLVNPFGTVFQPLALAQLLRAAAGEEQDWQQHVVEARGRWQSYDFHSTLGAESPVELLQTIQDTVRRVGEFVRTADAVVLTLGTAWAYRLRETGELVSNLHKLPASLFEKELLTADEIVNGLAEVHALLRRINPDIRLVLTVSPVRHIKDTLPLNAVSKSVLRVACHYLSELLPNVSYFPAYELLTDDLRDYRFYAADMLHPSEVAEDYIWERFARTYFDADFGRFRKEWAAVRQSLGHRPLHPGAPEHRTFLDQTRERLERLTAQGVDVRQELRDVQRQLAALPPPRPVRVPDPEPLDDEERIDIGDEAAAPVVANALASERVVSTDSRQERRQDNRRDGRRNDRSNRERSDNRPQPAIPAVEPVVSEDILAEEVAADEQLLTTGEESPAAETPTGEEAVYPAKKKKRRSRGGAKRTARKNAAKLATEQEGDEAPPADSEELAVDDFTPSEAEATTQTAVEALEEPASVLEPIFVDSTSEATPDDQATPDSPVVSEEIPVTAAQPTPARKRGTGPTPKKSKVITKSGLLKRGQRNPLYRPAPAEPTATVDPTPTATVDPTPTAAPIISPPIIPDALLERPAALEVFIEPTPDAPVEAPVTDEAPAAPAKNKRGRPKATPVTTDATPVTALSEEASPANGPGIPADSAEVPTKKAAARAPKTAKPKAKAPKKEAAKPAAPRRGRPPSKKTPPTDGEPVS